MKIALNTLKQEDIRQQIIAFLKEKNVYAGQFDFSSGNLSYFVDVMSIVSMLLSYNTSFIPNNIFLDTTELRKNGVSKAKELGYTPKRPYPAKFRGTLNHYGTGINLQSKVTIKPRSPFIGKFGNIYTNMAAIEMKPVLKNDGSGYQLSGDFVIAEGIYKYIKSFPTGDANFSFTINNPKVAEENFSIYVIPAGKAASPPYDIAYKWNLVKTFTDAISSNIYHIEEDITNEGSCKIVFGNGVFGKIPTTTDIIYCEYFETNGASANNESFVSLPPLDMGESGYLYYDAVGVLLADIDRTFQTETSKSFGGANLETLDSIKYNAPRFFSSVGRAATKNDYVYLLKTFPGVGCVNVIGGDELYPNNKDYLGNIYICIVPSLIADISTTNNIYISKTLENDIKNSLAECAIISTKRHFYNPTYISVDITPIVEINNTTTSTMQKDDIKLYIDSQILKYTSTKFNALGVPFRSSKISEVVDVLDYVLSSTINLSFGFFFNSKTFNDIVSNINDIIYLPVKNIKDEYGNITGTTNFIKTNSQEIQTVVHPTDWSILNEVSTSVVVPEYKVNFLSKTKLLNNIHQALIPSQASIFSKKGISATSPFSRNIYNTDYAKIDLIDIVDSGSVYSYTAYPYLSRNGNNITPNIIESNVENATTRTLFFYTFDQEQNIIANEIGNIYIDTNNNVDFRFSTTSIDAAAQKETLWLNFGIDDSQYKFWNSNGEKIPFEVVKVSSKITRLKVMAITYTSSVKLSSKVVVMNLSTVSSPPTQLTTSLTDWTFGTDNTNPNSTPFHNIVSFTSNSTILKFAVVEQNITSSYFKFFVGTTVGSKNLFYEVLQNLNTTPPVFKNGDYFIVKDFLISDENYYHAGDVLFVKGNTNQTLVKSEVKRRIGSTESAKLSTKYKNGDLFITSSGYSIYNEDLPSPHTTPIVNSPFVVDASQSFPSNVVANRLIKIVCPDGIGHEIFHPNTTISKLATLTKIVNGVLVSSSDTLVYNGDLLLYENNSWILIDNIYSTTPRAIDIYSTLGLSSHIYDTFRCIDIIPNPVLNFVVTPNNNVLNIGDYLIYNGSKWVVYDNDFYIYTISPVSESSKFPFPISIGQTFEVCVNGSGNNFNDIAQPNYTNKDIVVYYGVNLWKKYNTSTAIVMTDNIAVADVGDLIEITTDGGNLDNSSSINARLYNTKMLFSKKDRLIYTGTFWEKVNPFNIYNYSDIDPYNNSRAVVNGLGYNSEIELTVDNSTVVGVVMREVFDETEIGKLDYHTGRLVLNTTITKNFGSTTGTAALSNFYTAATVSDIVNFSPVSVDGNFDTNFNQYIVTSVQPPTIV